MDLCCIHVKGGSTYVVQKYGRSEAVACLFHSLWIQLSDVRGKMY